MASSHWQNGLHQWVSHHHHCFFGLDVTEETAKPEFFLAIGEDASSSVLCSSCKHIFENNDAHVWSKLHFSQMRTPTIPLQCPMHSNSEKFFLGNFIIEERSSSACAATVFCKIDFFLKKFQSFLCKCKFVNHCSVLSKNTDRITTVPRVKHSLLSEPLWYYWQVDKLTWRNHRLPSPTRINSFLRQ